MLFWRSCRRTPSRNFRAQAFAAAGVAQTIPDTYPAIRVALGLLNDHESFYLISRDGGQIGGVDQSCGGPPAPPATPTVPDTVGYVGVPGGAASTRNPDQFAESIQQTIRAADHIGLVGWIVDLRANGGGNMWPMLAGVGPVLGEGIVGWIVYNNREYEREYRAGAALSLGETFARVATPHTLLKEYPKVAVLTGRSVASAGEAIAVFFRGRPRTRSFGAPTCGTHHLQENFSLSDGAILSLTTAETADRMKIRYSGRIDPDEIIADPVEAVNRAIAWLQGGG